MINNDKAELEQSENEKNTENTTMPDEDSGIIVQGFLKIFDPESKEVLIQSRV